MAGIAAIGISACLSAGALKVAHGFRVIMAQSDSAVLTEFRRALALTGDAILRLINGDNEFEWLTLEQQVLIDTNAVGGNATLIASGN